MLYLSYDLSPLAKNRIKVYNCPSLNYFLYLPRMKKILLLIPACFILLTNCSIQKRHYEKGFTINWHHRPQSPVTKDSPLDESTLTASSDNAASSQKAITFFKENPILKDSCDLIEFKNNTSLRAKVTEIGTKDIRYKRCDNPDGPMYIADKSEILAITFSNGEREEIKASASVKEESAPVTISISDTPPPKISKEKRARNMRDKTDLAWTFGTRSLIPFAGLVFSVLGIIFSILALVQIHNHPSDDPKADKRNKIKAIIALALSVLGLAVAAFAIMFMYAIYLVLLWG
jgi:hypothetical protein